MGPSRGAALFPACRLYTVYKPKTPSNPPGRLPRVVWALARNGAVGEVDPGALAELLGHALLVFAHACLFLLENDGDA